MSIGLKWTVQRSAPYRLPHAYKERVRKELTDMEQGGNHKANM